MDKAKSYSSKILSLLMCFALLANTFLHMPITADATDNLITVITGSDYQENPSTGAYMYDACAQLMNGVRANGIDPYGVLMCGDYSGGFDVARTEQSINEIKGMYNAYFGGVEHTVFVQGNHDPAAAPSLSRSGNNDTPYYGVYVVNDDDYGWYNGDPANMSDGMAGHLSTIQSTASGLKSYLDQKILEGYEKPIFIAAHIPLHYSFRTRAYNDGQYAMYIVEVLNNAAAAGLNIIYLFGHNHSGRSDDYIGGGSVFLTKGDVMFVSQKGNAAATPAAVPLRFTYMNSGYIAYCANGNPGGNILNMAVFEIRSTNVVVKRCSANGLVPVGARCAWWTGQESASTYGTTDAYLKRATSTVEPLSSGYGAPYRVDASESRFVPVTALTSGRRYVITDSNTVGTANAIKYAVGDTGLQQVTVKSDSLGTYLTGVTSEVEWGWDLIEGSYGTLTGSGGRYLQIVGGTGGYLRTSSSYTETESGTRYSMWRLSSTASSGLYAYVYGSDYTNTSIRSYIRSTGSGLTTVLQNNLPSGTTPMYAFEKQTVMSSTEYVSVDGIRNHVFKPGYYSSWAELEKVIRAGIVVAVKDGNEVTTTSDYTLSTTFNPTTSGAAVITVFYQGQPVGAVTVKTAASTYPGVKEIGDINGDNKINGKDLIRLKKYINDASSSAIVYKSSDVNGDAVINKTDFDVLFDKIAANIK